ncbi:MAG: phospholipid carrier-dependent glycosyltransferase [Candidatus Heteroscillospira sp.]
MDKLIVVFPVTVLFLILFWYVCAYRLFRPEGVPLEPVSEYSSPRLLTCSPGYSISRLDLKLMLLLTAVYALFAFAFLGSHDAPESVREYNENDVSVFDFGVPTAFEKLMYFSSLHTGEYIIEYSDDGEDWQELGEMTQKYNQLFKWISPQREEGFQARYVRLTALGRMDLAELAFVRLDGKLVIPDHSSADEALFDEQDTVPERASYMNSAYFDEIYHPRTALEHLKNVKPYEISHPPLGKIIISIGIELFGMNPFGWRFMGTLFGVLMLPILYILLKLMFGCTPAAAAGTFVFAFDFMHFVQTRIATIDTYAVFFILVSFLFMFLFVRQDPDRSSLSRRLVPLGFSGIFWGIGCASKWTVIYFGAALGLIWLLYWVCRGAYLKKCGRLKEIIGELWRNILFCIVFFVIVPLIIYYVSYYPYGTAAGMHGAGMFFKKDYLDIVVENQKFMFGYHSDLEATHPYASRWWHWLIDARPILYYLDYISDTQKSAFAAFNGPMLCWGGLVAMFYMVWRTLRRRDFRAGMILLGYLSSLLPWVIISRLTFAYHYFPSMLFLAIALGYVFAQICQKAEDWRPWLLSFCGGSAVLFIMFYPVLTGIPFSRWYTSTFLRWFPGAWPF